MKSLFIFILLLNPAGHISAQDNTSRVQNELLAVMESFEEEDLKSSHLKCGFASQFAAMQKTTAATVFAAPDRQITIQSPAGRFNLHYDTTGNDAVPLEDISNNNIPDYIDSAAIALDYCWETLIDNFGYARPLDEMGQPVTAYDIYFTNFPNVFLYGQTAPSFSEQSGNWVSYIELNNDFSESGLYTKGLAGLQVTVAHEFFHAIQITYNVWNSELFFYEMSSSWVEDILYPEINDYFQYLTNLFDTVQDESLFSRSNEYANALYVHMLSSKYGIDLITEIWEQTSVISPLQALAHSLADRNSSISISINNYGKWLYFTGERSLSGQFFYDAASFPMINVAQNFIFNGTMDYDTSFVVPASSFRLLKADQLIETMNTLKVESNTDNTKLGLNIIGENFLDRKPSAAGNFTSFNLESILEDIAFVISNGATASNTLNFLFFPGSEVYKENITMGPNPVQLQQGAEANFYSIPIGAKIFIFNVNQNLIREMANENNLDQVVWDMKDSNGHNVSSGVYYYMVKKNGKSQKTGKIAVVR